jgi:hypothetical protein
MEAHKKKAFGSNKKEELTKPLIFEKIIGNDWRMT